MKRLQPQNIVFASLNLGGPLPGYFFHLLKQLASKGHKITIFHEGEVPEGYKNQEGIHYEDWPTDSKNLFKIYKLLKKENPDCVISNFRALNKLTFSSWVLGVKNSLIWYNTTFITHKVNSDKTKFKYNLYHLWTKSNFQLASRVIANSQGSKEDIQKHFTAKKPINVLNYLIPDPQKQCYAEIPEQAGFYITFLGRLVPSKDQFVAIRAMRQIALYFPKLQLKILGDGPIKIELQKFAEKQGVADNIQFLGHHNHATVFSVLKNSQANLCTSIDEAFGLVNIQALGMGVPVIGTNVGGIKDIVKDGWNGFLIEVGDEKVLAGKILDLLNDKKLHQSIAKQARHDFELLYLLNKEKLNKQCEQIEAILER